MMADDQNHDKKHIFTAKCPNGHVNYYDKRKVCGSQGSIYRKGTKKDKDELVLECKTHGCGKFIAIVDCEGYQ